MILSNLLFLFLLVVVITGAVIQRQLSVEEHARFSDERFEIGSILFKIQEAHLHLQQMILLNYEQESLGGEQFRNDYKEVRQRVEEALTIWQEKHADLNLGEEGQAHLTQYVAYLSELDALLPVEPKHPYTLAELTLFVGHLSKMERLVGDLLQMVDIDVHNVHDLWEKSVQSLRTLLLGALLLLSLLGIWMIYLVWQFFHEHQAIAAAFQAGERRHRVLLETIPDIVLRRTRAGIYTDFKPAKIFGDFIPREDFIGKHVNDILPPEIAALSTAAAERALDSGEEQVYEYRMPERRTGVLSDYEARVVPSGEDEVQVIVRDITADKLENEKLQQAQRLESLGLLAGGIAHDFNNLLTSMMAQLSLAKAKIISNQLPIAQVDKAFVATERAADLTRQLLAYAGKGHFQVVPLDLNQLIHDNQGILETALPNRGELQLSLAEKLPLIEADRGHLQQVVMNIAINAAEAFGAEKNLPSSLSDTMNSVPPYVRIETAVEEITTTHARHSLVSSDLQPGPYVVLRIQDNGAGMSDKVVKKIFDPFFSTKEFGHGLGLAATLGIVRTYGGSISVESQPTIGTTFTLFFPVLQPAAADTTNETQANDEAARISPADKASTVLVIDDETTIREVVTDILGGEGFTLLQACSGEEGIAHVRRHPQQIDLVLLDMKMPGLSGGETLKILHEIEPTLKVILSSGYTEDEIGPELYGVEAIDFLSKPYTLEQLVGHVNRALALPSPLPSALSV